MIIKFVPIAVNKIWGGKYLGDFYKISKNQKIGEIWGISAHSSKSNLVKSKEFSDMNFRYLYNNHRELFGGLDLDEFPILFKIIDAEENLSVQVHPNNEYALNYENSLGKDECWYILNTKLETTQIIIGHNAKTKEEFKYLVHNNEYEKLLKYYPIKSGDYFYIPSGTVHAICAGTTLLEISLSSDLTYRLYDYERRVNGLSRELHIEKSFEVVKIPDSNLITSHPINIFSFDIKDNVEENPFIAHQYGDYLYIISGKGSVDNQKINQGDFLMITSKSNYRLKGNIRYAKVNILPQIK